MGQRHAPAAFYPRERPGTHCTGGWVDPQGRSGQVWNISTPRGFDPLTVQSVASRYTDWATRPTETLDTYWNVRGFTSCDRICRTPATATRVKCPEVPKLVSLYKAQQTAVVCIQTIVSTFSNVVMTYLYPTVRQQAPLVTKNNCVVYTTLPPGDVRWI
jgi:hypothetical protein